MGKEPWLLLFEARPERAGMKGMRDDVSGAQGRRFLKKNAESGVENHGGRLRKEAHPAAGSRRFSRRFFRAPERGSGQGAGRDGDRKACVPGTCGRFPAFVPVPTVAILCPCVFEGRFRRSSCRRCSGMPALRFRSIAACRARYASTQTRAPTACRSFCGRFVLCLSLLSSF